MPKDAARSLPLRGAAIRPKLAVHDGSDVLHLAGELDLETVRAVDRFLRRQLGPFFHRRNLVLDLAEVTLIDSVFLSYVVRLSRAVRREGFELLLTGPKGLVRRTICVVGLANVVPVCESVDEATTLVAAAGGGPMIPPPFASS